MPRVDYSELVDALLEGDNDTANEILKEVIPRLEEYLRVVMGAREKVATECVHQAFLNVLEHIRKENIKQHKLIFNYLLKACKNRFVKYSKDQHKFLYDDGSEQQFVDSADQVDNLLDEERQRILAECLKELKDESKEIITWFLENPDGSTREASRLFGLSEANIRTRKFRITTTLHKCYKRKSSN